MSSPFALPEVDEGLTHDLSAALAAVETGLAESCRSQDAFISEMAGHLAAAGGKRFRPLLAATVSQLGRPGDDVVKAGIAVELVHLASLYHDDVMDEAPRRRGAESANQRWTNTLAILVGDFLFARASELVAELGPEAVRLQAVTFARLVEGQIHETVGPADGEEPVAHHLQVLADKTGALIALAARYGAMFGGLPQPAVEELAEFGESLGLAFQIADDLLDIASPGEVSGKTPGTDLREGIRTLPMLIVERGSDPADAELRGLIGRPLPDDVEHARALELMRSHPAMAAAQAEANRYADDAITRLQRVREMAAADPQAFADAARFDAVMDVLESLCRSTVQRAV